MIRVPDPVSGLRMRHGLAVDAVPEFVEIPLLEEGQSAECVAHEPALALGRGEPEFHVEVVRLHVKVYVVLREHEATEVGSACYEVPVRRELAHETVHGHEPSSQYLGKPSPDSRSTRDPRVTRQPSVPRSTGDCAKRHEAELALVGVVLGTDLHAHVACAQVRERGLEQAY